jgi:hypothetical protein
MLTRRLTSSMVSLRLPEAKKVTADTIPTGVFPFLFLLAAGWAMPSL